VDVRRARMKILAIDPGSEFSAFCWIDENGMPSGWEKVKNEDLFSNIRYADEHLQPYKLAIEMIASYGMAVGATVFETCVWIGRYWQESHAADKVLIKRMDVKNNLCHSSKANDSNVRQALIDRFGVQGTKKKPGLLYGMAGDMWAALGVGITCYDQQQKEV
jgi:hypothetical protein